MVRYAERWIGEVGTGESELGKLGPEDPGIWTSPGVRILRVREARPEYVPEYVGESDAAPDAEGTEADELLLLGDRIAELSRSIAVAEHEMMRLIVEFDRRQGWSTAGFGSCAEWLAWRVGIQPNAARERVRTALALEQLPQTAAAMAAGDLSYSKVRSLTRVATPDSEGELLDFAHAGSAAHLERVVRAWKALNDREELAVEQIRYRARRFSIFVDDDGSYIVKGRLEPEIGALVMRAVEAASDALYRRDDDGGIDAGGDDDGGIGAGGKGADPETTPAQRRADALGLIAERAFAAGFGEGSGGAEGSEGRGADDGATGGATDGTAASDRPDRALSGARAERYQVMLHVEPETLREDPARERASRSELDGLRVTAVTSRRLACDAAVVRVTGGADDGEIGPSTGPTTHAPTTHAPTPRLSVGRRTRTIPPALRRALEVRDRGCRFPGCGCRFTDAHHIVHWADGGRTDLRNLVLLCRRHHRAVHEGGMRVCLNHQGAVVFFARDGRAVFDAPRAGMPRGAGMPVGAGIPVAPRTLPTAPPSPAAYPGADGWQRDADIPWALEARARDAIDSG